MLQRRGRVPLAHSKCASCFAVWGRPETTKRQKRRLVEERYWINVRLNALARHGKSRQRREHAEELLFKEYAGIVAQEMKVLENGNLSARKSLTG